MPLPYEIADALLCLNDTLCGKLLVQKGAPLIEELAMNVANDVVEIIQRARLHWRSRKNQTEKKRVAFHCFGRDQVDFLAKPASTPDGQETALRL